MLSVSPQLRGSSGLRRSPSARSASGRSPPASRSASSEIFDITFEDACGENILLSQNKKEAEWNPRYSGAIALIAQSIKQRDIIQLEFEGNGHVEIGLTKHAPTSIQNIHTAFDKQIKLVNEIKIHQNKCLLTVKIKTGRSRTAISFSDGMKAQHNEIMSDTDIWLAINLKFGNVKCKIVEPMSRDFQFHSYCGENMTFLDSDQRSFKMKNENPSTRCGFTIPQGQQVLIEAESVPDGSRDPPQFSIKLGIRDQERTKRSGSARLSARPASARSNLSNSPTNDRNSGRLSGDIRSNNYTMLQVFDRSICKGNLTVSFQNNGNIMYVHSSGKSYQGEIKGVDHKYGAIFIMELFRTKLKITHTTKARIYDGLEFKDTDNMFESVTYARPNTSSVQSFVEFVPRIPKGLIKFL